MEKIYKFEISHRTIIFTVIFLLFLKFLWIVRELIFSLFIAFILMSALRPLVENLVKVKVPRILASLFVYFGFLSLVGYLFSLIFPPLIKETTQLVRQLPFIFQMISPSLLSFVNFESLAQYLPRVTSQIFDLARGIFSNAVFVISTLFFCFYLLLEEDAIKKLLAKFFEEKQTKTTVEIFNKIEKRMSSWFWGQLILMIIVGSLTFIGLNLIGIKYALALAVLAGFLEVIPNVGPTIAAVPAVLVGLSQSSFLGLAALALAVIVQQLENNLIVPLVMKKAVGLNPIIVLMALIIGGKLAGVLGILLAVPTVLLLETILLEVIKSQKSSTQ